MLWMWFSRVDYPLICTDFITEHKICSCNYIKTPFYFVINVIVMEE